MSTVDNIVQSSIIHL